MRGAELLPPLAAQGVRSRVDAGGAAGRGQAAPVEEERGERSDGVADLELAVVVGIGGVGARSVLSCSRHGLAPESRVLHVSLDSAQKMGGYLPSMAHLNLYLPDKTAKKLKADSRRAGKSLSAYVADLEPIPKVHPGFGRLQGRHPSSSRLQRIFRIRLRRLSSAQTGGSAARGRVRRSLLGRVSPLADGLSLGLGPTERLLG